MGRGGGTKGEVYGAGGGERGGEVWEEATGEGASGEGTETAVKQLTGCSSQGQWRRKRRKPAGALGRGRFPRPRVRLSAAGGQAGTESHGAASMTQKSRGCSDLTPGAGEARTRQGKAKTAPRARPRPAQRPGPERRLGPVLPPQLSPMLSKAFVARYASETGRQGAGGPEAPPGPRPPWKPGLGMEGSSPPAIPSCPPAPVPKSALGGRSAALSVALFSLRLARPAGCTLSPRPPSNIPRHSSGPWAPGILAAVLGSGRAPAPTRPALSLPGLPRRPWSLLCFCGQHTQPPTLSPGRPSSRWG